MKRTILRTFGPLVAANVLQSAGLYQAMKQTPDVFGRTMDLEAALKRLPQ